MELRLGARRFGLAAGMWVAVPADIGFLIFGISYFVGWDLDIYRNALVSLRAGHDPYLDATAVQRAFHTSLAEHPNATPPYSYVYSPMTLPLLRWIARFSFGLSGGVYWAIYAACTWMTIRVGLWAAERGEERLFAVLAPVSMFFPGLLHQDTVLSGNVAFLAYGCALGTAWLGWRRGVWGPFYVVVVAASVFKAPLLSLLAIPVFSARRQGVRAGLSAAVGVALFAVQPWIWPATFRNYLEAVDLQFRYNRDFSSSPAGVMADLLFQVAPYRVVSLVTYGVYATLVVWVLWSLSRRYLEGYLRLKEWVPVLLIGVILLNPRIMEYDAAPIALPLALVVWRMFARGNSAWRAGLEFGLALVTVNAFAMSAWKPTECVVLLTVFTAGCLDLRRRARVAQLEETALLQGEAAVGQSAGAMVGVAL